MFFRNFGYKAPVIELWSLNVTFAFTKPQGSRASTYTEGANAPKPRMHSSHVLSFTAGMTEWSKNRK